MSHMRVEIDIMAAESDKNIDMNIVEATKALTASLEIVSSCNFEAMTMQLEDCHHYRELQDKRHKSIG